MGRLTSLRVTHCPVNVAGIPWENVQALRRKGVDARLVVFNRGKLHPEADWSLDRHGGLPRRLATQFAALARLLPRTDVFHFYFGLTLVPPSLQFPILHATRKRSVFHYLGSDIRGKTPEELDRRQARRRRDRRLLRRAPLGARRRTSSRRASTCARSPCQPPSDSPRPLVVHAPSNREKKGTRYVIEACEQLPVELDIVEGVHHEEARERYARADIVVDQLNAGWHGVFALEAMALGKPVVAHLDPETVERSAEGLRHPRPDRPRDEGRPRRRAAPARREPRPPPARSAPRAAPTSSRCTTSTAIADRLLAIYAAL